MNLLPRNNQGCPFLILAPMEGVGDRCFRKAISTIGGFDEAVRDFLRVPRNAHVKSLSLAYQHDEIAPIPLAAQLMGSDPELLADMAREIEKRGAPRIDFNCGCPSNTVTGRGAGSSLLKDPSFLYENAKALVRAVSIPVTLKMRSGYEDLSLFRENLLAAEESGVHYITLHPRTKAEGYGPPAKWELIAEAKQTVKIPIVGNGDILNVQDALNMLKQTNCDALMIGRGSIINPFIFQEIKSHFSRIPYKFEWSKLTDYLQSYMDDIEPGTPERNRINKLKQLFSFLFKASPHHLEKRDEILTSQFATSLEALQYGINLLSSIHK